MSSKHRDRRSRSRSRSRSPSRNRSKSKEYEVAGEKRKEKRRAYEQRKKEREEQKKKYTGAKRKNQAGGTQKERRDNKALKIKQGFTNTPQGSGTTAGPSRVPLHKPAQLAKGFTTETVREKQTTFLQTYARMAAANTEAANKESTGEKLVELRVFKEDKSPVTRMDQWKIQFNISKCILTATRQEVDPATLWHRGTMLTTHHVVVFTNDQSAGFYKTEIGKMEGLQAFLPEEWPRANSIYCTLPGAAECITTEIGAHFAASTLGGNKVGAKQAPKPQDLPRERQVTGESTAPTEEEKEEARLLATEETPEELQKFQTPLTEEQEAELMKSCILPPAPDLDRTIVPDSRRSSSPKQGRAAKVGRIRKASGGYQTDVSDTVDTDKESLD
ncbi:hypothetical protein ACHWQZ_G006894 [Mnemiopsis leidyi]